jgi:hypothetical protein
VSPNYAGASKCSDAVEPDAETPHSSSSPDACGKNDDDDDGSLSQEGNQGAEIPVEVRDQAVSRLTGPERAAAFAKAHLDDDVATALRNTHRIDQLEQAIRGRWDFFIAGLCVVALKNQAARPDGRHEIDNPIAYAETAVKKTYLPLGDLDDVARKAMRKVLPPVRKPSAAATPQPAADEPDKPPDAAEIAYWMAKLEEPALELMARQWFRSHGLPIPGKDGGR